MPAEDHHEAQVSVEGFCCAPTVAVAPEQILPMAADSCHRPLVAAAASLVSTQLSKITFDKAFMKESELDLDDYMRSSPSSARAED